MAANNSAIYTHADGTEEEVEVLKFHAEIDAFTVWVPSLGRERQTTKARLRMLSPPADRPASPAWAPTTSAEFPPAATRLDRVQPDQPARPQPQDDNWPSASSPSMSLASSSVTTTTGSGSSRTHLKRRKNHSAHRPRAADGDSRQVLSALHSSPTTNGNLTASADQPWSYHKALPQYYSSSSGDVGSVDGARDSHTVKRFAAVNSGKASVVREHDSRDQEDDPITIRQRMMNFPQASWRRLRSGNWRARNYGTISYRTLHSVPEDQASSQDQLEDIEPKLRSMHGHHPCHEVADACCVVS